MDKNLRTGAYAVAVFVESPEGIPLVKDPKKPHSWWKFAGGRSEAGENAKEAAIREIYEELGLIVDIRQIYTEKREGHDFVLFKANLNSLEGMKKKGNDGEEIKVFSLQQIKEISDFMPNHRRILEQLGII